MINYLHCYANYRPNVDWNTCGQAAIATITDYWGRNPFGLPRSQYDSNNGRWYWDDGMAIDSVIRGGYGPDVTFGLGTSGGRIRDALVSYALGASFGYSGHLFWGWEDQYRQLQNYLYWNRPVPVCIDLGIIGGPGWTAHWAIAYKIADGKVYLGNCPWNPSPTIQLFQNAWQCRFLPYGFNHCGVYC